MLVLKSRDDLQKLIDDGLSESLTLDYKASPALNKTSDGRAELVKDVTAFANSAGGQIIYGIPETRGMPQPLDSGVNSNDIPPEWIEQVIETNSSPRIQGIRITKIVLDLSQPNMVSYVLSVPAATTFAPHQNGFDKKYYRRFEFRSVPMNDYEIRDLLRRGSVPELVARFTFADGGTSRKLRTLDETIGINTIMENLSAEPSLYNIFDFFFDKRLTVVNEAGFKRMADMNFGAYVLHRLQKIFMVPNDFPLIKGANVTVGPPFITLQIPETYFGQTEGFLMGYFACATGCNRSRFAAMHLAGSTVSISEFFEDGEVS
jgi:hypothetical protein